MMRFILGLILVVGPLSSFGATTITAPSSQVSTSFPVVAQEDSCKGQPIAAIGYSIDDSSNTTIFVSNYFSAQAYSTPGNHILHIKCWGTRGSADVTNLPIVVSAPNPTSVIPVSAAVSKNIQASNSWTWNQDLGTPGSSSGSSSLVYSPSTSGYARQFSMNYSGYGGEIWYDVFGNDPVATNFFYDADVYVADPSSGIANIEFDMNQVMSNGQTVIFGVQCDGWSGTWDYTINSGTPSNYNDQWVHSSQSCNPGSWGTNTWHHVQIYYSRDNSGNVTYHSIWLDGTEYPINITANSSFSLGWESVLLTNFQLDGNTSSYGSATAYLDNLTISWW